MTTDHSQPPAKGEVRPSSFEGDNALGRVMSHGRGGAGNIKLDEDGYKETEDDLKIPTLKSPVYTTGRGGHGNMAVFDPDHPEEARIAQDVEMPPRRPSTSEFHGGRGGAGNVARPADIEAELQREAEEKKRLAAQNKKAEKPEPVDHSKIDYRGWADRGKDLLFGKRKNKSKSPPQSA